MPELDFHATLRALHEGGVNFILVGGLAAVLNGAPCQTYDVDIVPAPDEENLTKLLRVLEKLDAISGGHKNLLTIYGPLDVLGSIGRGLVYQDLLPHSKELRLAGGLTIQVLNLDKIIALKQELLGEKDLAVLPLLRRTLEETKKLHQV